MSVGSTINSNGKAIMNPPTTAIAKGWCIWAPVPIPNASGIKATIALIAVINFGRNLADIE